MTDTLIEALDMGSLPPEEQEALLLDLNALIYKSSMVRFVEHMDEAARIAFGALIDSDAAEDQVEAFLRTHVPNADEVVLEVVQEISNDILAATGTNTN